MNHAANQNPQPQTPPANPAPNDDGPVAVLGYN